MWNVFDSSFIIIFLLYVMLRIKGLVTGDGEFRVLVNENLAKTEMGVFLRGSIRPGF